MASALRLDRIKVKRWNNNLKKTGFLCVLSSEGWQWRVDSMQAPILSLFTPWNPRAALVCRLYAIVECMWLMFVPTDLTFCRGLKGIRSPQKHFFFFVYLELVMFCRRHANLQLFCKSHIKHAKQRLDSNHLAALAWRSWIYSGAIWNDCSSSQYIYCRAANWINHREITTVCF